MHRRHGEEPGQQGPRVAARRDGAARPTDPGGSAMNPDDLGTALTEMAERWETPVFDPETLEQDSQARTRRHRYRLLAAAAVVVIAASGAITTTILIRSGDSTTNAPDTSS